MSLSRTISLAVTVAVLAATLSACGFRPLHGGKNGGPGGADLATIEIRVISNRVGQQLRNQLLDALTPRGKPLRPKHYLRVVLSESTQRLAVQKNSFATRANYRLTANFQLFDAANGEVVFNGREQTISSYNISRSDYTTLIGEKDAKIRATRALAEDIRTRLGVYFINGALR